MAPVVSLTADEDMWHWVAVELRFWREREGLSLSQMGSIMQTTKAVVSNIEHARPTHRMNLDHAERIDLHFRLGEHFRRLVRYARAGHSPDWFRSHLAFEVRARVLKIYELALVPGLLQTPEYARTLLEEGQMVSDVDAAVRSRMARQEILDRRVAPELRVLLAEWVLEAPIGGPKVMRAQLGHLLEVGERPGVSIRVVPTEEGFHLGLEGAFLVTTVPEGQVAYLESCGGGRLEQAPQAVHQYDVRWSRIGDAALNVRSSRALIQRRMEAF
ncbi:DUF5753 domain-containing protein [Actinomadura roseirufa]|uniref:DUF5753 domain-containing protein n=1 Tax=Actinomadura roseirufa TaxID=2094049 RepID=UPI0010411D43|nr:DUF5753 domain-containing protein [Actinomadura roseirufa]